MKVYCYVLVCSQTPEVQCLASQHLIMTLKLLSFLKFLYGRVNYVIFLDQCSLDLFLQKLFDWILEFPGLALLFTSLSCISKFKKVIHITWV